MEEYRNIKLVLEYEGTGLAGWQRQKDEPTVQGFLEGALLRLTQETVTVIGAGRTDAGVHAKGQVAHFKTASPRTLEELVRGGNALLPAQIAILSAQEMPRDFHARYHARSKVYDYDLCLAPVRPALRRNFVWHLPGRLDLSAMSAALECLPGRRDFAAFQSTGTLVQNTVREMTRAELAEKGGGLVRLTLEADGFLRHMVRAVAGTLVLVGRGRITPDGFREILEARDRGRAGPTAPAQGLCLRAVKY
ncbi:MAG: tRNA pseudouridine(38-40) synthase TruA [Thermodesulfobacteriota bacterium]